MGCGVWGVGFDIRDFQINISSSLRRRTGVPPVPDSGQAGRPSYELGNLFFGVT
ncbi:MAG: hypothetical protein F6J93_12240 [Oscillatoria sp. SIO1A7]|nr:hypothetical protein [Oscillatoria sp. SIO1A7]